MVQVLHSILDQAQVPSMSTYALLQVVHLVCQREVEPAR